MLHECPEAILVLAFSKTCILLTSDFINTQVWDIEITSWKARAYGIFTRVGEVSEIERVSAANE